MSESEKQQPECAETEPRLNKGETVETTITHTVNKLVDGYDAAFWCESYKLLRDAVCEHLDRFIHEDDVAEEAILIDAIKRAGDATRIVCLHCGEEIREDADGDWIDRETHTNCDVEPPAPRHQPKVGSGTPATPSHSVTTVQERSEKEHVQRASVSNERRSEIESGQQIENKEDGGTSLTAVVSVSVLGRISAIARRRVGKSLPLVKSTLSVHLGLDCGYA